MNIFYIADSSICAQNVPIGSSGSGLDSSDNEDDLSMGEIDIRVTSLSHVEWLLLYPGWWSKRSVSLSSLSRNIILIGIIGFVLPFKIILLPLIRMSRFMTQKRVWFNLRICLCQLMHTSIFG